MITITEEQLEKDAWGEVAMLMHNLEGYELELPDSSTIEISLEDVNQFIYDDKELCEELDSATLSALRERDTTKLQELYEKAASQLIEAAFRSVCEVV